MLDLQSCRSILIAYLPNECPYHVCVSNSDGKHIRIYLKLKMILDATCVIIVIHIS